MMFLQKTHPVPRTFDIQRRYPTTTREAGKHSKTASPRTPKEVKQFLGLVFYYCKFVLRFADISRVLTQLTRKDAAGQRNAKSVSEY